MYLFATHIPICVDGPRFSVPDAWHADLILARDYFGPHFGPIQVVGPSLPEEHSSGHLRTLTDENDGITLVPSFDSRMRTRQFWWSGHKQLVRDLTPLVQAADVVHCGVDDPLRPVQLTGFKLAHKYGKPTVLIGPDMAPREVLKGVRKRSSTRVYCRELMAHALWERAMQRCAPLASVCMLKEGLVYDTYSSSAKNPKMFCHSMHSESDIIPEDVLARRLDALRTGAPLRLVYFGRLVERKGVADSVRVVGHLQEQGVHVSLHLHGDGPQLPELKQLVRTLDLEDRVHFHGFENYSPAFLSRIASYDGLLFCPTEEDTPRMVYDAFACGLPLITTDIPFLRTRAKSDGASVLFPTGDPEAGCRAITSLDQNRESLAQLALRARAAGQRHTAKAWYDQRTQWTLEAVAQRETRPLGSA